MLLTATHVCRMSIKTRHYHFKCEGTLLDNQLSIDDCIVTIRKEIVISKLVDICPGHMMESVLRSCIGKKTILKYLTAGVYAIRLCDSCMYTSEVRGMTPIAEMQVRLS